VASINDLDVEDFCAKVSWPLHKSHGSAMDAFKLHVDQEIDVWKHIDFSQPGTDLTHMQEKLKTDIETTLLRRLERTPLRLQAKCEVSCDEYEGINAVKESLTEGFKASKSDLEVSIKLIAHPVFALSCMCRDKQAGIDVLDEAMDHIQKAINDRGGNFTLQSKPKITQKVEDKDGEDHEKGSDDEGSSSSGSSSEEEQDDTMGNLDESQLAQLKSMKLDDD